MTLHYSSNTLKGLTVDNGFERIKSWQCLMIYIPSSKQVQIMIGIDTHVSLANNCFYFTGFIRIDLNIGLWKLQESRDT